MDVLGDGAEHPFHGRVAVVSLPDMGLQSDRPRRVVCGVSGSDAGRAVVEYSKTLSDLLGAELVLVHVAESSNPGTPASRPFDPATYRSSALDRGAAVLQDQATAALATGARARVELGDAVARLLDAAAEEGASLLLLGWSSKRIFPGRFVGRLLRRASCPVVIVPPGAPRR